MRFAFALPVAFVALVTSTGCDSGTSDAIASAPTIVPQSSTIDGRDGAESGIAFGRSVWTFGDTVLSLPDAEGQNWHHNSFSFTSDLSAAKGVEGLTERVDLAGAPIYFIAPTDDEATFNAAHFGPSCPNQPCNERYAVWPGRPIWDAKRNRALIAYGLIHAKDDGFDGVGSSYAEWTDFDQLPVRKVLNPTWEHPTMLFDVGEPGWGTGGVVVGDDLYALDCDTSDLGASCAIAKVGLDDVFDRSKWLFFDGSDWTSEMSDRATIFSGGSSVSIGTNDYLGGYVAVYAGPFSNDVVMRTAPNPWGPWSDEELLFTAKKDPAGAYDANMHFEFAEQKGKVEYVSYTRSNGMGWFGSEIVWEKVTLP